MYADKIIVKTFSELTTEELYEILKARFSVFVQEQRCLYLDMDGIDYRSLHIFLRDGRDVIAYARLFEEDDNPDTWHIGRVLTVRRGEGLGILLMKKVIETARLHGVSMLRMDAQTHAIGFYEKIGFRVCSDVFEEAGMPHVKMEFKR